MKSLQKFPLVLGLVAALLAGLACSVDSGPVLLQAFAAPPLEELPAWLTVENAADCSAGCWRIASVTYKDEGEAQGLHHIFARARDEQQQWIEAEWHVAWVDGNQRLTTKRPPDWGDFPMFSCFSPDAGEIGGYWVYAGPDPARSDTLIGPGMPECLHVVYEVEFYYQEQAPMPPCELMECRRLYLPVIEG